MRPKNQLLFMTEFIAEAISNLIEDLLLPILKFSLAYHRAGILSWRSSASREKR
jgi:hypothetical protein